MKYNTKKILSSIFAIFFLLIIVGLFNITRIIDGFTSVEVLTDKYLRQRYDNINVYPITESNLANFIHEETRWSHSGAVCKDGWISHSSGRGTCSHHGGVSHWFSKGDYSKSIEECRKEAVTNIQICRIKAFDRSWIGN
jgi:hypothetical protein